MQKCKFENGLKILKWDTYRRITQERVDQHRKIPSLLTNTSPKAQPYRSKGAIIFFGRGSQIYKMTTIKLQPPILFWQQKFYDPPITYTP